MLRAVYNAPALPFCDSTVPAESMADDLRNIAIVLVQPSHPGNIGAVARAMKNMALADLRLVAPRFFPHPDAVARASGADDIIARAAVSTSLDEAVRDCHRVLATSARVRSVPWPVVSPREAAEQVRAAPAQRVAVVFGRESSGLTNEELAKCHGMIMIPANPRFSSLNLAAAVQIVAYELFQGCSRVRPPPQRDVGDSPRATAAQMERFYDHLERVLVKIRFLNPSEPRLVMRRLRRLFARAGAEETEINILRGILTEVEQRLAERDRD